MKKIIVLLLPSLFLFSFIAKAETVNLFFNKKSEQISFSANDIKEALIQKGFLVKLIDIENFRYDFNQKNIVLATSSNQKVLKKIKQSQTNFTTPKEAQSFSICTSEKQSKTYWVIGGDETGTMYGGLQLAMNLKSNGFSKNYEENQSPHIKNRGIKYNIPLDSRAPSYDSDGDAAHFNVKFMWDINFWKEYIDQLTRYRYNVISFWHTHPFTSMCKVPEYPDVVIEDVMDYNGLVKKMSIEDKIAFWHKVFNHAKNRGFDISWINWNIFAYGAVGKYGIEDSPKNKEIIDYSRKSLKAFLKTYPQIDGFGVHTGENFPRTSYYDRVNWNYNVWAKAILEFKNEHPERQIRFINRCMYSGVSTITEKYKDFPMHWDLSFKYAVGHMYGYTRPGYIYDGKIVQELDKYNKKIWLNIRNDDMYFLRWGDPEYVKQYILDFPESDKFIEGFYMGSDGYVWGKTFSFTEKYSSFNNKLEIDKHWYNFMLWGYLSYNPEMPISFFIEQIKNHYPETNADILFQAWKSASKLFPTVTSAFCKMRDWEWFIEGCFFNEGHYTIDKMHNLIPQSGAPIYSIREYIEILKNDGEFEKTTPIEIIDSLKNNADKTLSLIDNINYKVDSELNLLVNDIKAMAYAGLYYANKIEGTLYYEMKEKNKSLPCLETALKYAEKYINLTTQQYKDQHLGRMNVGLNTGKLDHKFIWNGFIEMAKKDIEIVKNMED